MNKREDVLREALEKNDQECQRWKMYLKENKTAIENMTTFGKRLRVDVMVPIGKKAFIPGYLIHTNELLVGHYQGYFSKCTTFKAKEICELRIQMAKEHLKKLQTEADLWQNKLNKPYLEGVMRSGEEQEIVEEFDSETERKWKENHRIRVKQAKFKERQEREAQEKENSKVGNASEHKTDEEIFKMLEEAEVMEELEQELDKLELDEVNDETVWKLMSGEMQLPKEKRRFAYENKTTEKSNNENTYLSSKIVKRSSIEKSSQINTNNNSHPNQEILNVVNSEDVGELEEETLPEEVALIKEQAFFLDTKDQIGFYDYQIEIIRQKIQRLSLRTQQELDEKIRLLNVLEYLEELLEEAEENVGASELSEKETEHIERTTNENDNKNYSNQKRRISFALEDQTLVFKKHEAVTEMLPSKVEKLQSDIIKLDRLEDNQKEKYEHKVENSLNKTDLIQDKVEKNLQFVAENQSKKDFDLVQQIIKYSVGENNTLCIKFRHSEKEGYPTSSKNSVVDIPANPADLYVKWKESLETFNEPYTLFTDSYEGEDQVKVPILKEVDKQSAYVDLKSKFSNPLQAKSILKNKFNVDEENQIQRDKNIKNKKSKKEYEGCSAYYKVMNDVVEKALTEPEPLPQVKFIDAHMPKKRISRFKKMRQEI